MECDICGKESRSYMDFNDLSVNYQTDGIKNICKDCESILNKHLDKIRSVINKIRVSLMKRVISNLKSKLSG